MIPLYCSLFLCSGCPHNKLALVVILLSIMFFFVFLVFFFFSISEGRTRSTEMKIPYLVRISVRAISQRAHDAYTTGRINFDVTS